jgi:hypothetical protein
MLPRALLRYAVEGGALRPRLVRATPAHLALAEALIAVWREHRGRRREELDEALAAITRSARSQLLARGLAALLEADATWQEPAGGEALRSAAFDAGANRWDAADPTARAVTIAAATAVDAVHLRSALYADLPHLAILAGIAAPDPQRLLDRYNLAQVQGLVLMARGLSVVVCDRDAGRRRRLLTAARWLRLLVQARQDDDGQLVLEIGGPGQVLDQARSYGLHLAQLLPHLVGLASWRLEAAVQTPQGPGLLVADDSWGLVAASRFLAVRPEELTRLAAAVDKRGGLALLDDPPLLTADDGELVAPDFGIAAAGRTRWVECFHRWHRTALERRCRQIARGALPELCLAIDKSLGAAAGFVDQPALAGRILRISGYPTASGLRSLLAVG